ncbi:MAG TPA: hypothetical protein VMM78_07880 [Thermomicrobiales bacterium]|nr:hypothetical protein [Thermomicrobiales bacterium]
MADRETDQRHLVAAIGYLLTPVVPVVVLTSTTKTDLMLRRHAAQALLWSVPFLLLLVGFCVAAIALLRWSPLTVCLLPFLFLVPFIPGGVWGRKVYLEGDVMIPVLTRAAARLFPTQEQS